MMEQKSRCEYEKSETRCAMQKKMRGDGCIIERGERIQESKINGMYSNTETKKEVRDLEREDLMRWKVCDLEA